MKTYPVTFKDLLIISLICLSAGYLVCLIMGCSQEFTSAFKTNVVSDGGSVSTDSLPPNTHPKPETSVVQKDARTVKDTQNESENQDSGAASPVQDGGRIKKDSQPTIDSTPEEASPPVATCRYCHLNSSHKQLCCSSPVSNICWLDDSKCEGWF